MIARVRREKSAFVTVLLMRMISSSSLRLAGSKQMKQRVTSH
jgi:hypothetical protein